MTEQSQLPLVGPPKRRGWREIVWFRSLTPSTHAALVVTRRGRRVSISGARRGRRTRWWARMSAPRSVSA